MDDLNIAEIPYETGEIRFRYSRYMSDDQTKWIRHGLFCQYYKNGNIASEGEYEHGLEDGLWKDYNENGIKVAEGHYESSVRVGTWYYWDTEGNPQESETF